MADSCEEAVPVLAERGEKTDPDEIPDVVPEHVTVRGDKAVVQPDGGFCMYLQRTDDEWLIPYLPLPGPDDPDASREIPPCQPDF